MAFGENLLVGCFTVARQNSEKGGGSGSGSDKPENAPENSPKQSDKDVAEAEGFIKRHKALLDRLFDR